MTTSYTTPLLPRHNRLPFFEFCWAICIGFYFVSVTHVILEYQHQIPWVMKLNNTDMWAFGSTETAWGCCLQRQMISRLLARQQLKFQSFWIMYWACFQALCPLSCLTSLAYQLRRQYLVILSRAKIFVVSHINLSFGTCHHLSDTLDLWFSFSGIKNRKT